MLGLGTLFIILLVRSGAEGPHFARSDHTILRIEDALYQGAVILHKIVHILNTSYLIDSYIVFALKIESVSKNTIFGLKKMVKSSLEKIFLKFFHAEAISF